MRLTVVVTTYERPDYLRQSLESIAHQTAAGSLRVIVQDNASAVDYSAVVAEFADVLDLEYVRNEVNLGASGNIERALTRGRDTDYLTVFHDDDLMHPRMLEWQMQMMDADPGLLFVAAQCAIFQDGTPPPVGLWDISGAPASDVYDDARGFVRAVLSGAEPAFSSVMYRTSVLDRVHVDFDRFDLYWDRPYLADIAALGRSALMLSPLVLYRIHGAQDSTSGALTLSILIELMKAYRAALDAEGDAGDRALFMRSSTEYLVNASTMLRPPGKPSLVAFLCRTRTAGVLSLRMMSRGQWLQLLQTSGWAWMPGILGRLKRLVRRGPGT